MIESSLFIPSLHIGKGRKIKPHQKIHYSAAFRGASYHPKAKSDVFDIYDLLQEDKGDVEKSKINPLFDLDILDITAAEDVLVTLGPGTIARLETLARSGEFDDSHFSN